MKKNTLLLLLLLLPTIFTFGQVPQSEKDALVALYNATDGSNWTNNTNWNTMQPVSTWYGITVNNNSGIDHVSTIDLSNNNLHGQLPTEIGDFPELFTLFLHSNSGIFGEIPTEIGNLTNLGSLAFVWNYNMTGSIPNSITNLSDLQYLYLGDNKFSGAIPDMTSLPLNTLWINNNNFEFGDFENQFSSYQTLSNFQYTPQNTFYQNTTYENLIGENRTLSSSVTGNNNIYQWYKLNTNYFSSDINNATLLTGQTNQILSLTNLQSADFGYYYCIVSNTVVINLEIKKEYFNITQGVPQSEKDALIALYNATDGSNWINNTNWLTSAPVADWNGVRTSNGHITKLLLYENNLSGTLPNDIQNLNYIERFSFSNNNLIGAIPDLTVLPSLNQLTIWNNYFQFGDFENEFTTYNNYSSNGGFFSYYPMKKIDTEIIEDLIIGNDYTFTMSAVSGTGVTYQWYKNNVELSGETGLTYTITNAQASDAANYTCKASSPIVTDLKIERNTIHLYGSISPTDRNALIMLYYATDGANWTNNTNWNTSVPVYDWYGVVVEGNRVKSINLSNNNLVGTLPTQIGDLDYLMSLNLRFNSISGSVPTEIGSLSNLETLYFTQNQFSGNIPSSIGNLVNLTNLSLNYSQFTGNIPTTIGGLTNLETLNLSGNSLSGNIPSELGNLTKITYLDLEENQLTGDMPVSILNLPNIYSLYLYDNLLSGDIDLSNLSTLHSFTSGYNLFTSIDLRNGNNSNMSFAYFGPQLPNLTCILVDNATYSNTNWYAPSGTHFVETETACDAYLTYVPDNNFEQALIDLGYDTLIDNYVPTENINSITSLNVASLNIDNLTGIEDFVALTDLRCQGNNLSSLNISNNIALTHLECRFNQLTSLDVSTNINLTELICNSNLLTEIDLDTNTNIYYLQINNNLLTSLDVSNNTALTTLYCPNNLLTSLNVQNTNNTNFIVFNTLNNPNLTCIFVDDASWSQSNAIMNDYIDPNSTFVETESECNTLLSNQDYEYGTFSLSPNPTKNQFTIKTENNIDKVLIYSTLGELVKQFNKQEYYSIENLTNGIYYVVITNEKGSSYKEIIKK